MIPTLLFDVLIMSVGQQCNLPEQRLLAFAPRTSPLGKRRRIGGEQTSFSGLHVSRRTRVEGMGGGKRREAYGRFEPR